MASALVFDLLMLVVFLVFGGIIWAVVALNKARGSASRGAWQLVAQQLNGAYVPGGGFKGQQIQVSYPFTQLLLEIKLMSAIDVSSSPYHQGRALGGTFTHAKATYMGPGQEWKVSKAQALQHASFHGLPLATLPDNAEIISFPRDVMIVMNGHVSDQAVLHAAAQIVTAIAQKTAQENAGAAPPAQAQAVSAPA